MMEDRAEVLNTKIATEQACCSFGRFRVLVARGVYRAFVDGDGWRMFVNYSIDGVKTFDWRSGKSCYEIVLCRIRVREQPAECSSKVIRLCSVVTRQRL